MTFDRWTMLRLCLDKLVKPDPCPDAECTWLNGFDRGHNLALRSALEIMDNIEKELAR